MIDSFYQKVMLPLFYTLHGLKLDISRNQLFKHLEELIVILKDILPLYNHLWIQPLDLLDRVQELHVEWPIVLNILIESIIDISSSWEMQKSKKDQSGKPAILPLLINQTIQSPLLIAINSGKAIYQVMINRPQTTTKKDLKLLDGLPMWSMVMIFLS